MAISAKSDQVFIFVVAQSTPQGEFDEMLLKAKASIRAIVMAATGSFDDSVYVIEGAETAPANSDRFQSHNDVAGGLVPAPPTGRR